MYFNIKFFGQSEISVITVPEGITHRKKIKTQFGYANVFSLMYIYMVYPFGGFLVSPELSGNVLLAPHAACA